MFQRQRTKIAGVFATNRAILTMGQGQGVPSAAALGIVQQLSLQLNRNYNRVYSLTSTSGATDGNPEVDAYLVGGRTQGQGQLGRLLGPKSASLGEFYKSMADECNLKDLVFNLSSGCEAGTQFPDVAKVKYTAKQATLSAVSVQVNANDYMVNEGLQLIFADLDVA